MMGKKIIFFDGDGTLWYPKKTKYKEKPDWIYSLKGNHKEHIKYLILTPTVLTTLRKLKKDGLILVLLSTHPQKRRKAKIVINEKVNYFKLNNLFDEIHPTPNKGLNKSKGLWILKILKKRKIPKKYALMVGDSYKWDYKPARDIGIDSVLIDSDYRKEHHIGKRIKKIIRNLKEVLDIID